MNVRRSGRRASFLLWRSGHVIDDEQFHGVGCEHVGVMAVGAAVPACAIGLRYGVAASIPSSAMARIAGSVTLVRMSTRGSSTRSFRRKPMITGVAESAPAAFMGPRLRGDEEGESSSSPHPPAPQGPKPPLQLRR